MWDSIDSPLRIKRKTVEERDREYINDACRFINHKARLEAALRLALLKTNIPPMLHDSVVKDALNNDFSLLETDDK